MNRKQRKQLKMHNAYKVTMQQLSFLKKYKSLSAYKKAEKRLWGVFLRVAMKNESGL